MSVRAGRGVVREGDAEVQPLGQGAVLPGDGEVVAMAVKESPLAWRASAEERVVLSEEGAVATQIFHRQYSLVTTGVELAEGKHFLEVKLLSEDIGSTYIARATSASSGPTSIPQEFTGSETTQMAGS